MNHYAMFAARTKVMLATFVGTVLLLLFVFPSIPLGAESLDVQQSYTFGQAMALMEQYGEDGRQLYAWISLTLDTLFPIIYVTFFVGVIYRFRPVEPLRYLVFLPIIAGFIDLGENIQVVTMLLQYPQISDSQVQLASLFTSTKHILGVIYQAYAVLCLVWAGIKFLVKKKA
ncbi:hypothetical protein EYS14_17560 [Alteromonadaceae bacterium M269]|nr:hypothetical protein EYS14_17560 [Alteromonadaceae bacterium M269]